MITNIFYCSCLNKVGFPVLLEEGSCVGSGQTTAAFLTSLFEDYLSALIQKQDWHKVLLGFSCSALMVLKFLIIFNKGSLVFILHCTLQIMQLVLLMGIKKHGHSVATCTLLKTASSGPLLGNMWNFSLSHQCFWLVQFGFHSQQDLFLGRVSIILEGAYY